MNTFNFCCILILFLFWCHKIACFANSEMQMFDLVEDVNGTFYEYLGVDGNATSNEIKRAYRKLSLLYHPDRNPNSEDAIKFQRLAAIYEILKDEKSRERYNEVLLYGLPDWKTSSYYFRKLRKMSFAESIILFSILATAIHYACLWGAYFEQKWNMEAFLFRRKRKRVEESKWNEELNKGYKPRWKDILPLAIVKFSYNLVLSTPTSVKTTCGLVKQEITIAIDKQFEQKRKEKAKEEERKKIEESKKLKKEKKQILFSENKERRKIYDMGILNAKTLPMETFTDIPDDEDELDEGLASGTWKSKDTVALIRALRDFPVGVSDRWLKIRDVVQRPLSQIVSKITEIQSSSQDGRIPIGVMMQGDDDNEQGDQQQDLFVEDGVSSELSDEQEICNGKSSAQKKKERKKSAKKGTVSTAPIAKLDNDSPLPVEHEDTELIDNVDESIVHQRKKPRKKTKYLEAPDPVETGSWTVIEQKQLEDAMRTFPKGTTDRWDRISNKVPTKTKAECIERIKNQSTEDNHNMNGQ